MGGHHRSTTAVSASLALVAALLVVVLPGDPAGSAAVGTLELVSTDDGTASLEGPSTLRTYDYNLPGAADDDFYAVGEAMSGDGCRVAFTTEVFDPIDPASWREIFLRDRCADPPTTEQVSIGFFIDTVSEELVEFPARSTSDFAAISRDGNHVAFASQAALHPDAAAEGFSVYVRDLSGPTPRTELISRVPVCAAGLCEAEALAGGSYDNYNPAISADGRFVAFTSRDSVPGSQWSQVLLYDRDADDDGTYDELTWADGDPPGVSLRVLGGTWAVPATGGDSYDPTIADDGSVVAFTTSASSILDALGGSGEQQVVAVEIGPTDPEPGVASLVSASSDEEPGNDGSAQPSISGDGRYVAFTALSTNLVPEGSDGSTNRVYRRDRVDGTTMQVSLDDEGNPLPPGSDSFDPAISGDGEAVAWAAAIPAELLVLPPVVLLRRVSAATTELISVDDAETESQGVAPVISTAGDAVGFQSPLLFGIEEPDNDYDDVWARDLRPALVITPDPLNLGAVSLGGTSAPAIATVTNVSNVDVAAPTAAELVLAGANAGAFTQQDTTCAGQTLAPTETCTITFTFAPAAVGLHSATITIDRASLGLPLPSATLVGTGTGRAAIQLTPDPVDHGTVDVGDSNARVATVTSIGNLPAPLFGPTLLSLSGPEAADFSIEATTCQDVSLAPGATCTITLRFAPSAVGLRSAVLTIDGGAPGLVDSSSVFGVGDSVPAIIVTPDPVDHGTVDIGDTSGPRVATVRSVGLVPAPLFGAGLLGIVGALAGDFAIESTTCQDVTLDPGETCTVTSRFTPSAAGLRAATLTVSGNLPGPTASTGYVGAGQEVPPPPPPDVEPDVGVPALVLSPDPIDFGLHLVGDVPASQVITGRSVGTAPLVIPDDSLSLTGPDPFSFRVMVDGCSGRTLAPGQECTIRVTGNPVLDGPRTADLVVQSNGVTAPDDVTMRIAGEYRPSLLTNPGVGKIGRVTTAIGVGYPPDVPVVLTWAVGDSFLAFAQTVLVGSDGSFQVPVHILDHERLGPRTLTGTSLSGPLAEAPFLVELPTANPPTFLSR